MPNEYSQLETKAQAFGHVTVLQLGEFPTVLITMEEFDVRTIQHNLPFDPTYDHSLEQLLAIEPPDTEPDDFAEFWRSLYASARGLDPQPFVLTSKITHPRFYTKEITYRVSEGYRVAAWVVAPPKLDDVRWFVVAGHGYAGRDAPDYALAANDRIVAFPVAPGFGPSIDRQRLPVNDANRHVLHGIDSRDTYIFRQCAETIWLSLSVLHMLYPQLASHCQAHYTGWSFGGGMGALTLPWDKRFVSAELGQPSFGHHPIRLEATCHGSGEAVRQHARKNPAVEQVLRYFDAATAAKYIEQPVVFACSRFDPAVPPPGQFAVANAHPGTKRLSLFSTGHFEETGPNHTAELRRHVLHLRELFPDLRH